MSLRAKEFFKKRKLCTSVDWVCLEIDINKTLFDALNLTRV